MYITRHWYKRRKEEREKKTGYTYQRQRIAEQYISRRVVRQLVCDLLERLVDHLFFVLPDLERLLIDQICLAARRCVSSASDLTTIIMPHVLGEARARDGETYIQITACGPVARDVVNLNLRRCSFVSCEKV